MQVISRCIVLFSCLATVALIAPVSAQETEAPATPTVEAQITPAATPTPIVRPTARQTLTVGSATVELYFDTIKQGGFGVLHVVGDEVTGASAVWLGDVIQLFPARDDGLYGFLTANIEQTSKEYDLEIIVESGADRASVTASVRVELGGFVRSTFIVPSDRVYLIDPEIERAEFARLSAVFAKPDQVRAWDDNGFAPPIFGELTSPFGELRLLNDTVETRHTGWDMRATSGVPIQASAAGRVAFAGLMDIRGNYVIIDHGFGVFSGYAHMSQIYVTRGQTVTAGQVLGLTGNTGRSSGPHLHWELNINGDWIDASAFSRAWIP